MYGRLLAVVAWLLARSGSVVHPGTYHHFLRVFSISVHLVAGGYPSIMRRAPQASRTAAEDLVNDRAKILVTVSD